VVTVGCGDVCPILPGIRYEDWQDGDPALASPAGIAATRADPDTRVRAMRVDLLPDLDVPPRRHCRRTTEGPPPPTPSRRPTS
jgi:arsenate reductase (thioredoxin)